MHTPTSRGPDRGFVHQGVPGFRPGVDGRGFFRGNHDGFRDGRGFFRDHDGFRDRRFFEPSPGVIPFSVGPSFVQPVPVPVPEAVPVPIPALQATVLPSLETLLPAANFAQNPPQFLPLQDGTYALISPALFCGTDQAACEQIAEQLAQMTPGWGTATLDGPDGYGVYVTHQAVS